MLERSIFIFFRNKIFLSWIVFAFFHSLAYASEIPNSSWTLERIMKRAIEQSPELKALEKDVVSFQSRARQAGKWDNPDLAINGGPMFSTPTNGRSIELGLTQKIPLFGQKAIEENLGLQTTLIAERDKEIGKLRVRHDIVQLTYDLAAVIEQSKHVAHRRERIKLISQFLASRPFASPSQWVEKNLVQNRLREVEEKFLDISSEKERAWNSLNVFLGLNASITPNLKWYVDPQEPNYEALSSRLSSENPEILRQKHIITYAELSMEQAEKKAYPDLQIGVGYNEQTAGTPQSIYSGFILLSLPIIDRGDYAREAIEAKKEAENYRLEQKRRVLLGAFAQARDDLRKGKRRIALYPLNLVSELENQMKRAEKKWKKGLVPVVAFLEMENQVHEQVVKVFSAQTTYVAALSQILFLAGLNFGEEKR